MNTLPQVSIIILNWNGWEDTIECLESVYQITYPNYDVIVVDNGSEDDSIQKIRAYASGEIVPESSFYSYCKENKPIDYIEYVGGEIESNANETVYPKKSKTKQLIVIKNEKNDGFAEGNNVGIKFAVNFLNPHYVLLLNNDTVVERSFLGKLVKCGEAHKHVGILGPNIFHYHEPETAQIAPSNFNMYIGERVLANRNAPADALEVNWISGCAMLVKREVIGKVGLLDKSLFLYYEDTDFSIRTVLAEYKLLFVRPSIIWHKLSASTKKSSGIREYYSSRNRFVIMKRYATSTQYLSFLCYYFLFVFWSLSGIFIFAHRNPRGFLCHVKGTLRGLLIDLVLFVS